MCVYMCLKFEGSLIFQQWISLSSHTWKITSCGKIHQYKKSFTNYVICHWKNPKRLAMCWWHSGIQVTDLIWLMEVKLWGVRPGGEGVPQVSKLSCFSPRSGVRPGQPTEDRAKPSGQLRDDRGVLDGPWASKESSLPWCLLDRRRRDMERRDLPEMLQSV